MSTAGMSEKMAVAFPTVLHQSLPHVITQEEQEISAVTTIELGYHAEQVVARPGFSGACSKSSTIVEKVDSHDAVSIHSTAKEPVTPIDPEHPYPPSVQTASATDREESKNLRRLRMFCAFCTLFLAGWNGGSTGALIPYIERTYQISYARVSVLFVANFSGYIVAAVSTGPLSRRVGFGYAMLIATLTELIGNVINSSQRHYLAVMCIAFCIVGFSYATQLGLCNAYFAKLDRPLLWICLLHGIYGFGSFASPLVATAMVTRGVPYNWFYLVNVGINVPLLLLVWIAFRKLEKLPEPITESSASLRDALKQKVVWTLALFLMFYIGAEESLGGWIVSFVLSVRRGSPEGASWVASAFYLGIALGRLALPTLNMVVGERRAVFLYILVAIGLECLAWLIPSMVSTAVCTALVGVSMSTFYSAAITLGGRLVPKSMHADAFSIMSAVGQSGQASWPLIVGIMSTKRGIWVVEPTVIALFGAQAIFWWLVPHVDRRRE